MVYLIAGIALLLIQSLVIAALLASLTKRSQEGRSRNGKADELSQADRLSKNSKLVSDFTHDVNQPLFAIQNFAQAVSNALASDSGISQEQLRGWLDEIMSSARQASDLARRLNSLVKDRAIELETTDIGLAIRDALSESQIEESCGVEIHLNMDYSLPPVEIDRSQVQQAIINLVKNACEAVRSTGGHVTITAAATESGVEVSVSDTGPGVPDEVEGMLFDAFVTTKPNRLGMGLPIAKTILEAHGSELHVESDNAGATFHFGLPGSA